MSFFFFVFWLPFLTQLILIYIICLVFSSFPMCSTTDAAWICIRTLTWPPTLPRPLPTTTPCRSPTPPWPSHSTNWWKPALSPSASAQLLLLPLPLLSTNPPSLIYKLPSLIENLSLQNCGRRHTTAIRKRKEINSLLIKDLEEKSLGIEYYYGELFKCGTSIQNFGNQGLLLTCMMTLHSSASHINVADLIKGRSRCCCLFQE